MKTNFPPLFLFGAGGHAKVVLDALACLDDFPDFIIDDAPRVPDLLGCKIIKNSPEFWDKHPQFRFHVAIGHNETRRRLFTEFLRKGGTPLTIIHPRTTISRYTTIGAGTFLVAGVIINPGTEVGPNCIINTGASLDHDCKIGAHTHICPGVRLAGGVKIGEESMIGTGTSIIPGITIGNNVTIGAGSVVVRCLPAKCLAYGVPARVVASTPNRSQPLSPLEEDSK